MRASRRLRWRAATACIAGLVIAPLLAVAEASPAAADPSCQNGGVYILWARGTIAPFSDAEGQKFQEVTQNGLNAAGVGTHAWAELGNLDGDNDPQNDLDPGEYPA